MKLLLGAFGTAVVLAGAVAVSVQANATTPHDDAFSYKGPVADRPIGGYEGWWNSSHLDGTPAGPEETVAVNTNTGKTNWAKNAAGQVLTAADATYNVVPDPTWPASSIVIIDTSTGKVIEDFPNS
ncbi:hypothetical protein ACIQTW_01430 [Paenarthrobacter sp. NPDC090517]|uniref:hypothetical protein n=1 Tax=Paenarthrobacter sp. NPDC090517 TaxID=3364381 RepID=UPI003811292F